jgi:hypothetical protein
VDRSKLLESFDFDNDKVLHNQVQPIGAIELDAAIGERDGALFFNFETASPQLEDQASNVSGFQQSGSQRSMDRDRRGDDDPSDSIERRFREHVDGGALGVPGRKLAKSLEIAGEGAR